MTERFSDLVANLRGFLSTHARAGWLAQFEEILATLAAERDEARRGWNRDPEKTVTSRDKGE